MTRRFPILWLGALMLPVLPLATIEASPLPAVPSDGETSSPDPDRKETKKSKIPQENTLPANPSELYARLSAATRPQWRQLYRPTVTRCLDCRQQAALGLGAVVADLFLAAQARDTQQIRNLIQDEETIEKTLGLIMPMADLRTEVLSAAEMSDWLLLNAAISKLTTGHRRHLREQKDESLAELSYIGEWLRALQICHAVAIQRELEDYQLAVGSPSLFKEMTRRLNTLSNSSTETNRCLRLLHRRLAGLEKLWPEGNHTYPNLGDRLQKSSDLLSDTVTQLLQEETAAPALVNPSGTFSAPRN